MACKHRKTWIMASGHLEWCYQCGAIRQMQPISGTNTTAPYVKEGKRAKWIKPTGVNGDNPWEKLL